MSQEECHGSTVSTGDEGIKYISDVGRNFMFTEIKATFSGKTLTPSEMHVCFLVWYLSYVVAYCLLYCYHN